MTKREILTSYRDWRRAHNNKKPDYVEAVIMWEDDKVKTVDRIGLNMAECGTDKDRDSIMFYTTVGGLHSLTKQGNGSDFILLDIVYWDKY